MPTLRAGTAARAAVLALCCALAPLLAWPQAACAQGTSGAFADPMSVGELKLLLEQRTEVPSGAWPQIQAAHDAYARKAEEFRNGDIERFQRKSRASAGEGDALAQMALWQSMMREYSELSRKLDAMDDELFAEVAKALESSPEALEAVESAKLARRRRAMAMGFGRAMMSPSVMADVEQVAFELPVPDAARAGVRQALAGYGRKQTPALRDHGERMQQLYLEFMKSQIASMQAASPPGAEGDGKDGVEADAMPVNAASGQEAWARLGAELTRQRKQLVASNRSVARAVRDALAAHPDVQQRFMDQWLVASYPSIPDSEGTGVPQAGRRAMRVRGLPEGAREAARRAVADWRTADDAIVAEWSAATEEFESTTAPFSFDDAMFRSFNDRVADLQRRRSERATQALNAIDAAVGPDLAAIVRGTDLSRDEDALEPERPEPDGAPAGASPPADMPKEIGGVLRRMQRRAVADWSAPMGDADVARIAAALAADEGQRSIIESLASDHAAGWAARIDPIFAESMARIEQSTLAKEPETMNLGEEVPKSIELARVHREALDAEFFDGLAAVASGPEASRAIASLRQLREVDGAARDDVALLFMMGMGEPRRARVDPLEGMWPAIPAARRAELFALLEAKLPAARGAASALRAASRDMKAMESSLRAMRSDTPAAEQEEIHAKAMRAYGQVAKAREALRAAEDSISEGALALISDDARARVRLQRTKARHPEYFREDPVQRAFDRALGIEGIDEALRNAVTTALAEYLSARDASEGALVQAIGARIEYPNYDAESPEAQARFAKQYEAWMLGNEKVERALFIRRGGRERALVALCGILGPQRAKAARVPDAAELAREEARLQDPLAADAEE